MPPLSQAASARSSHLVMDALLCNPLLPVLVGVLCLDAGIIIGWGLARRSGKSDLARQEKLLKEFLAAGRVGGSCWVKRQIEGSSLPDVEHPLRASSSASHDT